MKCPCCGSNDVGGVCHNGVICWDCHARMRWINESIEMISCSCGKHDDGKMIKTSALF